jgi:glyoxylate reductase
MKKIYITRKIPNNGIQKLQSKYQVDIWDQDLPIPREILLQKVVGCEGILCMLSDRIDAEVMEAAGKDLKVISNYAVGYNNIDVQQATQRGIFVGNTPDVLTDATADIAFALMISAVRWTGTARDSVHQGLWKTWSPLGFIGQDLKGKTIGIVGLGRIGKAMATRCYGGWNMNVLYCGNTQKPDAEERLQARYVSFEELLQQSDFISVHAPLTEKTNGMFDKEAFGKMKTNCVFVNTARGQMVDQKALYQALQNGTIFAAGLDVTDPEPLPLSSPLLSLPNCFILPHIGSATTKSRFDMAEIAANNVLLGLEQKPLQCWVNPV